MIHKQNINVNYQLPKGSGFSGWLFIKRGYCRMQFNIGDRVYIGRLVKHTSDTNHETLRLLKDEFGKITKIYTNKLYKIEIGETNIVVTEEWLIKKTRGL